MIFYHLIQYLHILKEMYFIGLQNFILHTYCLMVTNILDHNDNDNENVYEHRQALIE